MADDYTLPARFAVLAATIERNSAAVDRLAAKADAMVEAVRAVENQVSALEAAAGRASRSA
jgi:hypothetical protein